MPPEIALTWPDEIFAGEDLTLEVGVTVERETRSGGVEVRIQGREGWALGGGNRRNSFSHHKVWPNVSRWIAEPGVLPRGTSIFPVELALPSDMAPSHQIEPAYSILDVWVRVRRPWWFDARERFTLKVRRSGEKLAIPPAPAKTSGQAGPAADSPRLEISVASASVIIGDTIVGSCAMFHLADDRPRDVELRLVADLTLRGGGFKPTDRSRVMRRMTLVIPAGGAGAAVPFELEVPYTVPPSFLSETHALTWSLVAASESMFSHKMSAELPLELYDESAVMSEPPGAPPRLGEALVAAAFEEVARSSGWRLLDGAREPAVERELDTCRARIAYEYRGEAGTFVSARLDHPSLGLDLSATRGSSLGHVFLVDIQAGIPAWDRAYHVTARAEGQATPVVRAVAPLLAKLEAVGTLVRWDDRAIVFERAVTTVYPGVLADMAAELTRIAPEIRAAAATIEAPAAIVPDLDAWRGLARWLRGTLTLGDLAIDGTLDERPVEVRVVWDDRGQATAIRVAIRSASATAAALHAAAPEPPAELVDLTVADGVAAATAPVPADAARVRTTIEALRTLVAALEPRTGPYR